MSTDAVARHRTEPATVEDARFVLGVVLSAGLAFGLGWPLPHFPPILVAMFLKPGTPPLGLRAGVGLVAVTALGTGYGSALSTVTVAQPTTGMVLAALSLLGTFYLLAGGLSPATALMLIVGVTVLPVVGLQLPGAAPAVAKGIVGSAAFAVLLAWILQGLIAAPGAEPGARPPRTSPPPSACFAFAARRTVVVVPFLVAVAALGLTGALTSLVYVALLAILPGGPRFGVTMLQATVLGGVAAVGIYGVYQAVPSLALLLALLAVAATEVVIGLRAGGRLAPLLPSALNAVVVILGASLAPTGPEASAKLYSRIFLIGAAVVYVALASSLIPTRNR